MNRNIRQTLLAPALLLLAAATLGLAGCTQGEDALQGADGNDGVRILNINVGPKQGFLSGDADNNTDSRSNGNDGAPGTRSTVDESTGVMAWEEGDRIFVLVECNDAANTKPHYTLIRNAADGWDIYEGYLTTYDAGGNLIDLSAHTPVSAIKLPLGTTAIAYIRVNYTDSPTRYVPKSGEGIQDAERVAFLDGGSCDFMHTDIINPAMDASITIALTRSNLTRLHFPGGLTPGKKYYVDGFHSQTEFGEAYSGSGTNIPFTADTDGSLTICFKVEGSSSYNVTLKEKDTDAVVYTATFNVAYGSSYRCIIPAAGGVNPDNRPDLLIPIPIVPGNAVYVVNGYFVTAPDANANKTYPWAASDAATVMDNDPCAGHGGWRMPTMKDFEKMAGWTVVRPWSQDAFRGYAIDIESDKNAWSAAFPLFGNYYSSDARSSDSNVWVMRSNNNGTGYYEWNYKSLPNYVRCVQVK